MLLKFLNSIPGLRKIQLFRSIAVLKMIYKAIRANPIYIAFVIVGMEIGRIEQRQISGFVGPAINIARFIFVQLITHSRECGCPCVLAIYFVPSIGWVYGLFAKYKRDVPECGMPDFRFGNGDTWHGESSEPNGFFQFIFRYIVYSDEVTSLLYWCVYTEASTSYVFLYTGVCG